MEDRVEIEYPYLGRFKTENERDQYVVWFLREGYGVVVVSNREDIPFGTDGDYDEGLFEILPQEYVVRLSNDF